MSRFSLWFPLLAAIACAVCPVRAQAPSVPPKYEVRAVWLTTLGGMDWPRSHVPEEQQASLRRILQALKARNFNTILFQVRSRGNALYPSPYEPWAEELTGVPGRDPGWDPLAFVIHEAHNLSMEVHAWLNIAKVFGDGVPPPTLPTHVVNAHPGWVKHCGSEWWVDMGIPEVRRYTERIVLDVARRYNIDGVNFDYLRYPGSKFDDWETFRTYGEGMGHGDWRRNNITTFVAEVYRSLKKEKPFLKIGSSPIGLYHPTAGIPSDFSAYDGVFQEAREWLARGIHDYLTPQVYWDVADDNSHRDPDFRALSEEWERYSFGRHVYTGIGLFKKEIETEAGRQVAISRRAHSPGQVFFRTEHVLALPGSSALYPWPALIPPMPWIDSIPPPPPAQVHVTATPSGFPQVRWKPPSMDLGGHVPSQYVVYRSLWSPVDIDDPRNIVAILPADETVFVDSWHFATGQHYVVTALDAGNNESAPGLPNFPGVISVVGPTPMVQKDARQPVQIQSESPKTACLPPQNYPEPFAGKTYIIYDIFTKGHVDLVVKDLQGGGETRLVNEVQEPGTYIALFDAAGAGEGSYECSLHAGDSTVVRVMKKK
jgi:uncharacterized lipoprotein YddW (UPF0748 family)